MTLALQWDGLSKPGSRESNEDAWLACAHPQRDAALFAVADGLGGHAQGAVASHDVIQAVQAAFLAAAPAADLAAEVLALLGAAHAALQRLREAARAADGDGTAHAPDSTLVLLLLSGDQASHAHLGDSRLYRRRGGTLLPLTADHSLAALMASTLPPRQDPDRAVLLRSVSHLPRAGDVAEPVPVRVGDAFLLCSDGLWQAVDGDAGRRTGGDSRAPPGAWLAALDGAVQSLADPAQDNYTAVAVTCVAAAAPNRAEPADPSKKPV